MNLIDKIKANAIQANKKIVLAEGEEERTLKAADIILDKGYAGIVLLGNKAKIEAQAAEWGLKNIGKAEIIDPMDNPKKEYYAEMLCEIRKKKGMTIEEARKLVEDPLYLATLLIKNGDADGEVTGAQHATGDVLRPAFQIVKTLPGISVVSGAFIMCFPDKKWGDDGIMVFADCAADPNTDENKLAQIAVVTAQTARTIAGIEPRVAMLSFSTKGSAKHELVDKVVNATRIAKEMDPNLLIDGDLQADAAIIPEVAAKKAPGSPVAGKANVLVFPSLEVGNIAYKLVQRMAGADAVGPVMQGMAAPINDLSRGCSVEDIVSLVAITACQAAGININVQTRLIASVHYIYNPHYEKNRNPNTGSCARLFRRSTIYSCSPDLALRSKTSRPSQKPQRPKTDLFCWWKHQFQFRFPVGPCFGRRCVCQTMVAFRCGPAL